jgi:hypothetical protein
MKRVLLFLAVIAVLIWVVGCDGDGGITDDNRFTGEYIDTSYVDLMYYLPKDGNVTEAGQVTFYIDYAVDPTEYEWDGFYLSVRGIFNGYDSYYVSERKDVHEYSGLIPFNFDIETGDYKNAKGKDLLLFCYLYKFTNLTKEMLAVSDTLIIHCK